MDTAKCERLEEAGFRVGTVAEFLSLTPEESELVESTAALTRDTECRGAIYRALLSCRALERKGVMNHAPTPE